MSQKNEINDKKIAIFFFENNRDINTYPYIINAAKMLVEHSYRIDIFLNSSMTASENIHGANFIILNGDTFSDYVFNTVMHIQKNALEYICFFAYTFEGIVISYMLNRSKQPQTPVVYFSLELIYNNFLIKNSVKLFLSFIGKLLPSFKFKNYILKKLSFYKHNYKYYFEAIKTYFGIELFENNSFIIASVVQDEFRGCLLKDEFKFVKLLLYLPNGYIGYTDTNSKYAMQKFNIPENKKILLYSGGLFLGASGNELFELSKKISDEYILFLNIYADGDLIKKARINYHEQIKNFKLYINSDNLSCFEYDELVKSSYICIAWYKNVDIKFKNIYFMGLSSGKLTKYLSCGKPVIVPSYIYGYQKMIDDNHIGYASAKINEIQTAVKYIEDNYFDIQKNIEKFYTEKIEYSKFFNILFEKIEELL